MSTDLVQINPAPIPPLHQSTEIVMSCERFYVESVIRRRRGPASLESARGSQVHRTHAAYQSHCGRKQVSMDLDAFDQLAKGAGPLAAKILSGVRDNYQVDFAHLFATEVGMSLDENFQPTDVRGPLEGLCADSEMPVAYSGTPDSLYPYQDEEWILIPDWKSHPRPFEPNDTLQAKMYSLFAFMHFPWAKKILFRLVFVRYKKAIREVEFRRADVPSLIEAVHAARERQKMIHVKYAAGKEMEAIPGPHCQYCPLLTDRTCPIAEFNPAMQLSNEDRLHFHVWYGQFSAANTKVLSAYVQATGRNVIFKDGNGKPCVYGPVPGESKVYPVFERDLLSGGIAYPEPGRPSLPIIEKLMDHLEANPKDTEFLLSLTISSTKMNSGLKADKRVHLDQSLKDDVFVRSRPTLRATWPPSVEETGDEEAEDEEED